MKKAQLLICPVLSIFLSFSSIYGQELDEHLRLLAPIANKNWEGEIPCLGEGAKREFEWKVIWNGKAIKQTTETKMLHSISEAYFYWDSDKQEIGVFSITSNGNFFHGHAVEDDGKILIYGYITFPDEKLEFRNTHLCCICEEGLITFEFSLGYNSLGPTSARGRPL